MDFWPSSPHVFRRHHQNTMGHRWTSRPGLALQHFCGSTEVQDPSDADLSDAFRCRFFHMSHVSMKWIYSYIFRCILSISISKLHVYIYIYIYHVSVCYLCVCVLSEKAERWPGVSVCLSFLKPSLTMMSCLEKYPGGQFWIAYAIIYHIHPSIHPSMYLYMCISVYNLWIHILIYIYTSPYCFWWRLISEYPSCFIDQCWGSCNAVYHWASMSFWVVPRELSS